MTEQVIGWTEWETKFKPVNNPVNEDEGIWGSMYETYGDDIEVVNSYPANQVWTLVDTDPNSRYVDIISGVHYINRLGYFITEVPWEGEVIVSHNPMYKEVVA